MRRFGVRGSTKYKARRAFYGNGKVMVFCLVFYTAYLPTKDKKWCICVYVHLHFVYFREFALSFSCSGPLMEFELLCLVVNYLGVGGYFRIRKKKDIFGS
ncbi:uncharacterized protein V2V93DRAFT_366692 [Kockiozyma suomiensis]|uniref:uncharacterized protein n=1 Tax=Kockiozyma suomiensis TaxID=1337062 RepID=UPI0033431B9E